MCAKSFADFKALLFLLPNPNNQERVELQNEGNVPEEGKFELNDNHTHYIIVKDNTVSKTGINLFALRIIQYLSTVGGKAEFATDIHDGKGSSH